VPELPEVESLRQSLAPYLIGRTISKASILWDRTVLPCTSKEFIDQVKNKSIVSLHRHGKYMTWMFKGGDGLVVHLRMTGQVLFSESPLVSPPRHLRLQFNFNDGSLVYYCDQRKFGRIQYVNPAGWDDHRGLSQLGPDAILGKWTPAKFAKIFQKTRRKIKTALLDQSLIAGVGNIYADESLYQAGIHPESISAEIPTQKFRSLLSALIKILNASILEQGTTFSDYRNARGEKGGFFDKLIVYGHTGQPCPKCNNEFSKITVAQRGTHFCIHCQTHYGPPE
jgi:formamidopyrimidine-DNA glycosylase